MGIEHDTFADVPRCFRKAARRTWHQRRRLRAVTRLVAPLAGTVLDYGCGYGDLAYAISRTHAVRGVDVDARRIAFASHEYAPLVFETCGENELPFADATFDIVVSMAVIHFVPNPAIYLREAGRVLRDGGHLVIGCINQHVVRNALRAAVGRAPVATRVWVPEKNRFRAQVEEAGFTIQRETHFYDPPFEGWKNAGDYFVGGIQQLLSVANLGATASYYLFSARKSNAS
jgi:SAM-dependent methyltransferase